MGQQWPTAASQETCQQVLIAIHGERDLRRCSSQVTAINEVNKNEKTFDCPDAGDAMPHSLCRKCHLGAKFSIPNSQQD
jgi:predicted RNA-binding Zn-ribbon protein involved in translation (DUF1610 family)